MFWCKFLYLFSFTCVFVIILSLYNRYDLPRYIQISVYANVNKNPTMKRTNFNSKNLTEQNLALLNLTEIIQQRLHRLQFPSNCATVKKLLCKLPNSGFSSQMHLRAMCLMAAYITGRTWVPSTDTVFDVQTPRLNWTMYFQPITNCTKNHLIPPINSSRDFLLEIQGVHYRSPQFPPAFPSEFAPTMIRYHSYPPLFWIGQFQTFLIRYQQVLEDFTDKKMHDLPFAEPMVGIQVRRGDKLKDEAIRFEIQEYMTHAQAWFSRTFSTAGDKKRRIFLLTDEYELINKTVSQYPEYEFLHYPPTSNANDHYSHESLLDIVAGIHALSRCTYVVCTFSSNICRLAYELAQVIRADDSIDRFVSLDATYYFWGQNNRYQIGTRNHTLQGDLEVRAGDVLEVPAEEQPRFKPGKQNFDGYIVGRNMRTGHTGRYPLSTVREKWTIY